MKKFYSAIVAGFISAMLGEYSMIANQSVVTQEKEVGFWTIVCAIITIVSMVIALRELIPELKRLKKEEQQNTLPA